MEKKITMKAKVLDFVESKGTARYTDIVRFIVDTKFGEGTYDKSIRYEDYYKYVMGTPTSNAQWVKSPNQRKMNYMRGYYSGAFSGPNPYFLKGDERLCPIQGGYKVVRKNS